MQIVARNRKVLPYKPQSLDWGGWHYATSPKWIKQIPHTLPLLLISGATDPVGGAGKGVERFYALLQREGFSDVTLKLYPEARHEILNELNKVEVMRELVAWMDDKI